MGQNTSAKANLTPKLILQLAAPHTWAASVIPVLASLGFAYGYSYAVSALTALVLLVICVLMQSSVNTFNDYYDYIKGADTANDNVDRSDSVLVYNNVRPVQALVLAICFLLLAFVLGLYIIYISGFIPLVIALIGAGVVFLYSGGKTPISYLPIGEIVSGFVMGGLIPLACFYVLTSQLNFMVLVWSIPIIIGIGLIMMTNNTCDTEKDIDVGRNTLPVVLGRTKARVTYHALIIAWIVAIIVNIAIFFTQGWMVLIFMIFVSFPVVSALYKNPLSGESRISAMAQICSVNIILGAFYIMAMIY